MFVAGVDIGGTFTDCALIDDAGAVTTAKVPSTPDDFSRGFFDSLSQGAAVVGRTLEALLADTVLIAHGTTVATNVMAQRRGATVGLLTTMGHRDVLAIMRAYGRVAGLPPDELLHYSVANKPVPIVRRELIEEVYERVDCKGEVVLNLDEEHVQAAVERLLAAGVESIAVSFLWSFRNPRHELRVKEMISQIAGDLPVTIGSDLVQRSGEYERTMAVAVNSYVAPASRRYLETIADRAKDLGYQRTVLIMECSGGVSPVQRASEAPVRLIGSGPAGGLVGAQAFGAQMGAKDIITTDMGGTTFDVALVVDGEPVRTTTTIVDQCEYFVPTLDIRSIGAGGGSIAWYDPGSGTVKVGPHSAGADPGPICYGRGATAPTVTDADVALGYLNPDYFLGGRVRLDKAAALAAFENLGREIGATALEVAAGVTQIVDFRMADLIRKMTIERGYDPRSMVVFAYGGGGPLHAGVYARELGAAQIVVPLGPIAAVFSALGVASSDLLYIYEHSGTMFAPWDQDEITARFEALEDRARMECGEAGFDGPRLELERVADIRYRLQVHNVEVPIGGGRVTEAIVEQLERDFEARYEALFGRGTGYKGAGIEIATLRVRAIGRTVQPTIATQPAGDRRAAGEDSRKPSREIWWHELGGLRESAIFDGSKLRPGHVVEGPAVIELPHTTVLVRPEQLAYIDPLQSIVIDTGEEVG